jgi:threonine aldolase
VPIPTTDGKLTPALIEERLTGMGDVHRSQPKAVSITQATEYGTVYSLDEIKAIAELCRRHNLLLHMDGARLANAAASLGVPLADFTLKAGVDVLSFGGTKNGLMGAEAVVFADVDRSRHFGFVRKQGMQLASKTRFLAAQFGALLEDDLWLSSARHANAMAARLHEKVRGIRKVKITQAVQANAVFAIIPHDAIAELRQEFWFYVWNEATGEVRWMTSFDTTEADVDRFATAIQRVVGR